MTEEDALKNAREAIEEYIEICKEERLPVPKPKEFSGKFNVRIPKTLHRVLAKKAEEEGVSLNQLVVSFLSLCSKSPLFQENTPKRRGKRKKEGAFLIG